jgi:radical SAM-linked protein
VARMWERALRRAGLPVAYTGGFSPRPQLSFGLALPTGCESLAEYLDIALTTEVDPAVAAGRVGALLPSGIEVVAAAEPESGSGSLQEQVTSCTWEISVADIGRRVLEKATSKALAADSLPIRRERKGRAVSDDLRPSLLSLRAADDDENNESSKSYDEPVFPATSVAHDLHHIDDARHPHDTRGAKLVAELSTRPRGVRPVELAQVMGIEFGLVRRTCQWIERDGSRFEPLDARVAVAAVERAS